MKAHKNGILAIFLASGIWGLAGMFYKYLAHIPPLEVLAHRTIWSLVFFGVVLVLRRRMAAVVDVFKDPKLLGGLMIAAVMIAINWGGFIIAIQFGYAIEASLGYYIFPLVAVVLGVVFFGESFSKGQVISLLIIVLAVLVLSIGLGSPPWIALLLASTFSMYALLKKRLVVGPTVSVFVEVVVLAPLALIWLFGAHLKGWSIVDRPSGWFGGNWPDTVLLMLTGPLTAGPLILFSSAAQNVRLSTVGLIQYVNPSLQFAVAALIFLEPVSQWHKIALPMIWLALAIYTFTIWRAENAGSRGLSVSKPRRDD